jgi:hypothetical protein
MPAPVRPRRGLTPNFQGLQVYSGTKFAMVCTSMSLRISRSRTLSILLQPTRRMHRSTHLLRTGAQHVGFRGGLHIVLMRHPLVDRHGDRCDAPLPTADGQFDMFWRAKGRRARLYPILELKPRRPLAHPAGELCQAPPNIPRAAAAPKRSKRDRVPLPWLTKWRE